jgi:hypothetical protein
MFLEWVRRTCQERPQGRVMAMLWEYWVQTLTLSSGIQSLQDALNEAGGKGWELVSVTQDGDGHRYTLFWKRQR